MKRVRIGLIGLGLMGKEFASSVARWCNLPDELPTPEIVAVCDKNENAIKWFTDHVPTIKQTTSDYKELLESDEVDAIYCAVPHNLHEQLYCDIIRAGKHLLAEKPFGIDKKANSNIMKALKENPDVFVRCSSEFPFYPDAQRLIKWIKDKKYGQIMEVRGGFHHSSDMDLSKPINWKRMVDVNGEYGCMGDLGLHVFHVPLRMGWVPETVFADLQNIAETRPDANGDDVPCNTWDNAHLICKCTDSDNGKPFSLQLETRRMMPGATNTWYLEVYGTKGSARYTTHDPKAFYFSEYSGSEQAWSRVDMGMQTAFPVNTGGIFEFGFADSLQQMIAAFVTELSGGLTSELGCVTPAEAEMHHKVVTAALESYKLGKKISLS